jgi:hypothetical protein
VARRRCAHFFQANPKNVVIAVMCFLRLNLHHDDGEKRRHGHQFFGQNWLPWNHFRHDDDITRSTGKLKHRMSGLRTVRMMPAGVCGSSGE